MNTPSREQLSWLEVQGEVTTQQPWKKWIKKDEGEIKQQLEPHYWWEDMS